MYKIYNLFAVLAILISLSGSFLSFNDLMLNTSSGKVSRVLFLIFIFVIIILSSVNLYFNHKTRKDFLRLTQFYHSFNHDIRDYMFDIENCHKQNFLTKKGITSETHNICNTVLNYLVYLLEGTFKKSFNANIKCFDEDKEGYLYTLCRSDNTPKTRLMFNNFEIEKYCGFDRIYNHNDSHFYAHDLDKVLKKYEHIHNGQNYHYSEYYSSSVVAPIRIKKELVKKEKRIFIEHHKYISNNEEYYILGFVCIDSPSVLSFNDDKILKKQYTNLLKFFADSLFLICDRFHYIFMNVPEKSTCLFNKEA